MATLQTLRKRLKSIQATADMASALRTASSVKYARISRELANIEVYSKVCDDTLALFGGDAFKRSAKEIKPRNCLVVFTNSRGFCGGFNSEILKFFESCYLQESEQPLLLVFGQKGIALCQTNAWDFEEMSFREIPSYADAEVLTKKIFDIYASGEADRIEFIYQRFDNMMRQTPTRDVMLPHPQKDDSPDAREMLFLPDMETAVYAPSMYCLTNSVYRIMLGHCAGIQAATTIAMRNACDNAEESIAKLETLINRIRQAEVTNSVIETSSFLAGHFE